MGVRLIAGRAGSGKTFWCQSRICEALASSLTEGPRLIMLVPEQAGLQMERALLARSSAPALGRCEVLSFRRLAHRILNEAPGPMPAVLTPTGRQMALRHLIGRHRGELREFGKVAERGGFVTAIAQGIVELLQESVTTEQLDAAAEAAEAAGDPSAPRLHDAALLYRAYLAYLGSRRVDPEGVLDLAGGRLGSVPWIEGAWIWIDGFAGLTQQQGRMIVGLARRASQMNMALLLDPQRRRAREVESEPDDLSLFARTERTWHGLARALREAGVAIEEAVLLDGSRCPRFDGAAALERLERCLFAVPAESGERAAPYEEGSTGKMPVPHLAEGSTGKMPVSHSAARVGETAGRCEGTVRLMQAPDRRAEVAAAIRALVDLVQRAENPMRYRDVAIVVRDLEPYHDLISAGLRAHGVPFFIDRRRPTYHHPLVQLARGLLAMQGEGPFDRAVALVLKSGLSGLDDEAADGLENYLLAHGLASADVWAEAWTYWRAGDEGGDERGAAARNALTAVNGWRERFRERIGEWWPTAAGRRGRPACRTWVERLYAALKRLGVRDGVAKWCDEAAVRGDLDEAEEHEQVWLDLVKLLDELAETLGEERMTGRQFRDVLESGLSSFTLGLVPATLDQVLVGSIERSRHPPVRAVFVLGFEDGQFPSRPAEQSIFGDEERQRLEGDGVTLGRTRAQQVLDERMLAYIAVTRPSEFLWVSYPASNEGGRQVQPSRYWASLQTALPGVEVETAEAAGPLAIGTAGELAGGLALHVRQWCEQRPGSRDGDTWLSLYDWARSQEGLSARVGAAMAALGPPAGAGLSSSAATAALWHEPYRTSVTRLEQFAACPFQHYAARGLVLAPRAVHEISALDMGSLYHTILEQFVNGLMETGRSLHEMSAGEIAGSLSHGCQVAIAEHARRIRMEERQQKKAAWRSGVELPAAVTGEQSAIGTTPLRPAATEKAFGGGEAGALPALRLQTADGRTVSVRGKIDRVDVMQAGDVSLAVVHDYKRSLGRRLRLDEVYHGLALQLLAYLLVIRDHGQDLTGAELVPGGAFYLPLLGPLERVDHPDEAAEEGFNAHKGYRPRGIVDFDWIDRLDPTSGSGWSSVFSVFRKSDGGIGNIDKSDAVTNGALPALLDRVRLKMSELAEEWLSGNIAVAPARLGKALPCSWCPYRAVCRYEFALKQARSFAPMTRSQVLDALSGQPGEQDG